MLKKAILLWLVILLGFSCTVVWAAAAGEEEELRRVHLAKVWTVSFNLAVDAATISDFISVSTRTGERHEVFVAIEGDGKTISITPASDYRDGMEYSLTIHGGATAKNGAVLARAVVVDFIACKDESPEDGSLPVVGSVERLNRLLSSFPDYYDRKYGMPELIETTPVDADAPAEAPAPPPRSGDDGGEPGYAETNVQVAGVDEADIVKTDGNYLYYLAGNRLVSVDVRIPEQPVLIWQREFGTENFNPAELYLDGNHLVVIGNSYFYVNPDDGRKPDTNDAIAAIYPEQVVKVVVFDLADRTEPRIVREIETEGYYNTSRKIDSSIYLITNKSVFKPWRYYYQDGYVYDEQEEVYILPRVRDTAVDDGYTAVDPGQIRYFPGFEDANYLILTGFSLERLAEAAEISTYLGFSNSVYASRDFLYVSLNRYGWDNAERSTRIFKFALRDGKIGYVARGEVPGTVLNQFSMDEYKGNFRIATTSGEMWRDDQFTSRNHVYILNPELKIIGRLEGIAPTERIYAMRFMGDKGYMVTFRQVDPFFVLDLQVPENPRMLGYLKIPGYSDYLHPYDEDHILGFGKEVEEHGDWALEAGFKMALFDVSDVENPAEKFKLEIGGRGTDSELLRNHKALLFSKDKNIIAFPITIRESTPVIEDPPSVERPGEGEFDGADPSPDPDPAPVPVPIPILPLPVMMTLKPFPTKLKLLPMILMTLLLPVT